MGCVLLNGITAVCQYDTSGVEKLWLANKDSFTGATSYDDCGEITGFTWDGVFYEIEAALDSVTFTDELVVNGSRRNFLQTINFNVGSVDCTILGTLEDIGLSNLIAFAKLSDGTFRAFGTSGSGLRATVISENSGTNTGNDGSLAVTLSGTGTTKARLIDAAYAATIGLT